MSTPLPGPLARPNYLSWPPGPYQPDADPNSPAFNPAAANPAASYPLDGDVSLGDEQYHRPLERLHGMGMHAAGVAFGLQLSCVLGQPGVTIAPGLALDTAGRHIYLATGGQAEVGLSPVTGSANPATLLTVSSTGVVLPTIMPNPPGGNYPAGSYLVVAQWRETWNPTGAVSNHNNSTYNDTPWLQLVTSGTYNSDLQVILGQVVLDANGNVTSAGYGDVGGLQRTSVSLPAQSLQLQRAATTGGAGADTVPWGAVRAREAGGVEIAVAKSTDQINLLNGAGGNFATLAVSADQATFGDSANPGINLDGAAATIYVGAPGNYGDVLVADGAGHRSVSLVGDTAHVIVGGETLNGAVRMLNAQATDTMALNGQTGSAVVQRVGAFANDLIDVDTFFLHIHGADLALDGRSKKNNRALVDWGNKLIVNFAGDYGEGVEINSSLHVDDDLSFGGLLTDRNGVRLMASPVRKVATFNLRAGSSSFSGVGPSDSPTLEVDFGATTQFTAFAFMTYIQNYVVYSYNAVGVVEIYQIDNNPTNITGVGGPLGNVFTPVVTNQSGRTVGFRVRTADDSIEVEANIIIFYE
jgi:hypothetical protein